MRAEHVRQLLKEMREERGWSQATLADECGKLGADVGETWETRQQWASRRERGQTGLLVDDVAVWARACGYDAVLRFLPLGTRSADAGMARLSVHDQRDVVRLLDALPHLEPQAMLLLTMLLDAAEGRPGPAPPAGPARAA